MSKKLSPRLKEILALAAKGSTDKQIAAELGLSLKTVESHWKRLREFFGVSSHTEMVARVMADVGSAEVSELRESYEKLLYDYAELGIAERELRQKNDDLEALINARAEMLNTLMSQMKEGIVRSRRTNPQLSEIRAIMNRGNVYFLAGEWGGLWPKTFVSENVKQLGYDADDILTGRTPIGDMMVAEDLPAHYDSVMRIEAGARKEVFSWRLIQHDAPNRKMFDFVHIEENSSGRPAKYLLCSVDVTDFLEPLRRLVAEGWPDDR